MTIETGEIRAIFSDRGFGFIRLDNSGGSIFFHVSGCERFADIEIGDVVEFELGTGRDGRPRAVNVMPVP